MNIQIKHRFNGRVLYECEAESMPEALQKAIAEKADLRFADLRFANLRFANLRFADLRSADLSSADLSSADLRSADLRSADLRSANLSSADLLVYQTDIWTCYIQPGMIRIGCQYHKPETWNEYSDELIAKMESRALDWWKRHKAAIFAIHATFESVD